MTKKQKLQLELKNTPADAPQVGRSVSPLLNKVERPSATDKVLDCNNAEVDQQGGHPGKNSDVSSKKVHVFVLDARGNPLMPCSPRKARVLLKEGKAVVVKARPFFTIRLTEHVGGTLQPISLGVDTGYEFIGFALVGLACYCLGQIRLDNRTSQRLKDRAMYRRVRRNKHHWYRPARWQNRANAKKEGRLMPSVLKRLNRHIWLIEKLKSICPVTDACIETASFDIQKINNPEIRGRGYQEGDKMGYANTRAYLFARESGVCQYCGKKIEKGYRSEIHHIVQRSQGGTDKPSNLALLHDTCHQRLHVSGGCKKLYKNKQYKAETAMNVLRSRLLERFPVAIECFGYETQTKRKALGLEKTHCHDAYVIAGGMEQTISQPLLLLEKRKNNRSLQIQKNGHSPSVRKQRYALQPNDLIWINGKRYAVAGSHSYGKQVKTKCKKNIATSKVARCYHFGTVALDNNECRLTSPTLRKGSYGG